MEQNSKPLAHWNYSTQEWDRYVTLEKGNKKEDNIYLGISIAVLGALALMFFRDTGFWLGLAFSGPLAILIPLLRVKLAHRYLKKGIKNPEVKIYSHTLLINDHKVELKNKRRRIKSLKIIDFKEGINLLEFDIQWITAKGPTNDEYRIPIPRDKKKEAEELIVRLK